MDLPRVTDLVVSTIQQEIPAYSALSQDQLSEVAAITSWGVNRVLDLWVSDSDLDVADINRFKGIGATRGLDGRPLHDVLRAYRLAGTTIVDLVANIAGDNLSAADAFALARLWMTTIDRLSAALSEGHALTVDRVVDDRARALADLLDDLIAGRQVTLTSLTDRSRQLGITLPEQPSVTVISWDGSPSEPGIRAPDDLLEAAGLGRDEAVLRRGSRDRAVMVSNSSQAQAISAAACALELRGCVVTARKPSDVRRAHLLADLALDLAPRHAHHRHRLMNEGDAQVLALLVASPVADPVRVVDTVLGKVVDAANAHILEGLDAFNAHGSAAGAATHLGLHPQSMRYRMRRVRHLTGRDPSNPWDRFVLEVAMQTAVLYGPIRNGRPEAS